MSRHDDAHYLVDMLVNCRLVVASTSGTSLAAFLGNREKQDSVALRISLIGEAARHVTEATRERIPQLPWPKITAMRHRIAHEYNEIDAEIVWRVATEHVPEMLDTLSRFLEAEGRADS